jgi:microcompartment protein CcmK/EutM
VQLARVVGTVVATRKDPKLDGATLLLVENCDLAGRGKGVFLVAVDAVGAGEGEVVLHASGSSARLTAATDGRPVDCTIMAIVDVVDADGAVRFNKGPR